LSERYEAPSPLETPEASAPKRPASRRPHALDSFVKPATDCLREAARKPEIGAT
jgi:hypothetical protein